MLTLKRFLKPSQSELPPRTEHGTIRPLRFTIPVGSGQRVCFGDNKKGVSQRCPEVRGYATGHTINPADPPSSRDALEELANFRTEFPGCLETRFWVPGVDHLEKITIGNLPPITETSTIQHQFCAEVEALIYRMVDYQDSGFRDADGAEPEDSGVIDGLAPESSTTASDYEPVPAAKRPRKAWGRGEFHELAFSQYNSSL